MNRTLIASFTIALLSASPLLSAAPQGYDDMQQGHAQNGGKAHTSPQQNPGKGQSKPEQQQQKKQMNSHSQNGGKGSGSPQQGPGKGQGKPGQSPQKNQMNSHSQQPPKDFSSVHQAFRERRGQIGQGGPVPANVRIQRGKPLPHGYGKRLDDRALQGLPHYQGYEWRRVGSDVVLVTVATGIVYTILQGVLN
ncbi:MAG: anti-virulence regulator CigR family protein [Pseudomonas sp.]|uniref:anti-virulence regulator CigR family protein n=1 Tax=Pseudomonas sp. TaxID=306 RepID=UPI003981BF7B